MKKLAYFIYLLILASPLYADSKTTGSLGLLQPSTNTLDKSRSWGDKLNVDMQIIDSSVTTLSNNISGITASIGSTATALYTAINSTNSALITAINSTNSALTTAINSTYTAFQVFSSTTQAVISALQISTTNIQNFYATVESTQDARLNALSVDTTTIGLSTTIILNQESPDISERTYFLHDESSGNASMYRTIMSSPATGPEINRSANLLLASNIVRISSHITLTNDPGVRKIPAGVWSFTSWAQVSSILNVSQLVVTISTIALDGTGQNEVVSSTSTNFLDTNVDRFDMVAIQQNDVFITTSDRILVQYFGRSASIGGITMTLYYAGTTRFSHLNTPIGNIYKFTQLSDAPPTLVGQRGKFLSVNDEETATVFVSCPAASTGGGVTLRDYDIYIGTPGTPGVDCFVSNLQQFNLALASIGACGLTTSATGYGTMYFRNGNYPILGATIPAGVYMYAGSTVVWQAINGTNTLVTNYGRMDGFKFDLQNTGIASRLIDLSFGSQLTNFQIYNATGLAQGATVNTYRYYILGVSASSNVIIQGDIRDLHVPTGAGNYGDNAPFKIVNSTNVDVRISVNVSSAQSAAAVTIYVEHSAIVNIHDCFFNQIGADFLQLDSGNSDISYVRNRHVFTRAPGDNGIISLAGQRSPNTLVSTGTMLIEGNIFKINSTLGETLTTNVIQTNGNGGASAHIDGLLIRNNEVSVSTSMATFKFSTLTSTVKAAVVQGNTIRGLPIFISDTGTGTLYISQGNTLDAVEQ